MQPPNQKRTAILKEGLFTRDASRVADVMGQIRSKDGGHLFRTLEVGAIDEAARTVELAFSSETPVSRWFGDEVLDHSPGAVDLSRLQNGGANLMDHDWTDQVGVVIAVSIDGDRRGRATVKFSRSERAQEVFQDVIDGIRRHVSVGYSISDIQLTGETEGVEIWTVTRWQPFEISWVSVPADTTVGVGRQMENPQEGTKPQALDTSTVREGSAQLQTQGETQMLIKNVRNAAGDLVRAEVDENGNILKVIEVLETANEARAHVQSGATNERQRVEALLSMGERFKEPELARQFVAEGKTPEQFNTALLDKIDARAARPLSEQTRDASVGLNPEEVGKFSFIKAIRALVEPGNAAAQSAAAFEFEASRAAAQKFGKNNGNFVIPPEVLARAFNTGSNGLTGAGSTGSNLIATTLLSSSFIDILRHKCTLMQMASTIGGLVGNIDIPKQISAATGYWLGEDDPAPESELDVGQISLSPKTAAARTQITRKMLQQSSLDAEALLRSDLAKVMALTLDKAGYYGTGTQNQPLGIFNQVGIHAQPFAGTFPTFAELVEMETLIALDDADVESMKYIGNAALRGYAKTALKFPTTAASGTIWEPGNSMNGYGTVITNQMQAGDVGFGNFADVLVAMWGGLELNVDPFTGSAQGRVALTMFQDVDVALRRTQSFCIGRKAAS